MPTQDEKYMKLCFELAMKGAGNVSPNPLVGAVIVKNDRIVSTGYHQQYGCAHAEKNAVESAKEELDGATLYCNLEPCVHNDKQTPPCVPTIIESGIKKVVISNIDPNPKVNWSGIKKLKEAGIEVVSGVLHEEGKALNRFYLKSIKTGLPYVALKIAISSDGKIAAAEGVQTWLTCDKSREFVHDQRSVYDAVLIGANTVNIDNPELTVRSVEGRNPIRIILDGNLSSRVESKIFNDNASRTIIACSTSAEEKKKRSFREKGIEVIQLESVTDSKLNLETVLKKLNELKISSLFVEGGRKVFEQFITQQLFDEIIVLKAPVILGRGIDNVKLNEENLLLTLNQELDEDKLLIYKPRQLEHVHGFN